MSKNNAAKLAGLRKREATFTEAAFSYAIPKESLKSPHPTMPAVNQNPQKTVKVDGKISSTKTSTVNVSELNAFSGSGESVGNKLQVCGGGFF